MSLAGCRRFMVRHERGTGIRLRINNIIFYDNKYERRRKSIDGRRVAIIALNRGILEPRIRAICFPFLAGNISV